MTLVFAALLCLLAAPAPAQAQPTMPMGSNPLADPFALATRVQSPAPVPEPVRASPVVAPTGNVPHVRSALPASLHVLLIGENGMGLLSNGEAGATSIPVFHGKWVRLLDQEFVAEVSANRVKLLLSGGRLAWEGALVGTSVAPLPPDTSQMKYIPPLSAGVNPGLGAAGSSRIGASAAKSPDGR
jgi:hypothetical protein